MKVCINGVWKEEVSSSAALKVNCYPTEDFTKSTIYIDVSKISISEGDILIIFGMDTAGKFNQVGCAKITSDMVSSKKIPVGWLSSSSCQIIHLKT